MLAWHIVGTHIFMECGRGGVFMGESVVANVLI